MQSNFIEITLRHGCSPVNLLHIFKHLFPRTRLKGYFYHYLSVQYHVLLLHSLKLILKWFIHLEKPVTKPENVIYRSSRPEVFCKKGFVRNFTKFIGKHLCHSLFFNKCCRPRPATLLKKRLKHRCFPMNFVKFLTKPFFTEHLWWLLLHL